MKKLLTILAIAAASVAFAQFKKDGVSIVGLSVDGNTSIAAVDGVSLNPAPTPDLLWWKVQNSTTLTGDAATSDDGTMTGATATANDSTSGYWMDLDGTGDGATTDATIAYGSSTLTISFWVEFDNTTAAILMENSTNPAGNDNSFYIYWNGSSEIQFLMRGNSGTATYLTRKTTSSLSTATLYHVLVWFDATANGGAGDSEIYIDGSEVATTDVATTKTTGANFATQTLYAGGRNAGASLSLNGRMDDIRIFSTDERASAPALAAVKE